MAALTNKLQQVLTESTFRHACSPEVTFDAYRDGRYETLRQFVSTRRMVYLDMNFWISLRNPAEATKPNEATKLLAILRNGVKSGQLLCPVGYTVFVELMRLKKGDGSRSRLARLMDELSLGVGLRNPFDIARIEYLTYFASHVPRLTLYIDHVWAPIGHLIHEVYPYQDDWPHEFMEQGRKVMCDVNWARTMEHLAQLDPPEHPTAAAATINTVCQSHPRGGKTFTQLFASELDGAIEVVPDHVDEILVQMRHARFSPIEIETMEKQRNVAVRDLRSAVLRSGRNLIPSQRIYAALHAAMRLDDGRLYKPNDLHDFQHASVAVAYCDLFLTDGPLAHLLTATNVRNVIPDHCCVFGFGQFESAIAQIESAIR